MKKLFNLTNSNYCGSLCRLVQLKAQGTPLVVQTFDYSMTYGSGPWSGGDLGIQLHTFPDDPNLTFEKIIMIL